ncbi:MAG: hypothetical protein KGJ13_11435 [Patescibacteria group bacterium]|nr:hypothetical protein [Patescibacteria group bacterium]
MTILEIQYLWVRIMLLPNKEKDLVSWCAFCLAFGMLQANGGELSDTFFAEVQKLLIESELRAQNETRPLRQTDPAGA